MVIVGQVLPSLHTLSLKPVIHHRQKVLLDRKHKQLAHQTMAIKATLEEASLIQNLNLAALQDHIHLLHEATIRTRNPVQAVASLTLRHREVAVLEAKNQLPQEDLDKYIDYENLAFTS